MKMPIIPVAIAVLTSVPLFAMQTLMFWKYLPLMVMLLGGGGPS